MKQPLTSMTESEEIIRLEEENAKLKFHNAMLKRRLELAHADIDAMTELKDIYKRKWEQNND